MKFRLYGLNFYGLCHVAETVRCFGFQAKQHDENGQWARDHIRGAINEAIAEAPKKYRQQQAALLAKRIREARVTKGAI